MKKILIFYASYGGGHLSAANSINNYIENNTIDVIVTNPPYKKMETGILNENKQKLISTFVLRFSNCILFIESGFRILQ